MKGSDWEIINALDYCSKITDGTHDSPRATDCGKPLVTSKHIKGREIDFTNAYLISEEDYSKINLRSKVEQWDVIISMIGEYCGFCYIERNNKIEYAVKNVGLFKTGSELKANWLYYFLNSAFGKSILNSSKSGSSQPYLTLGSLRDLKIRMPSNQKVKEQIVKILSSLDSKIELNNRINAELEAMAKTLYDYWFVQFDFPDKNGKPYKSSGGKMVWNEELKREVPEGWEVMELNKCIKLIIDNRGKTPTKLGGNWTIDKDGIIALSAKIVKGGKLNNLEQANKVDRKLYEKWMPIKLQNGDVLMTSEAPAGEFYFIYGKTEYCLSQRLFAIRADQKIIIPIFLYYELSKGHSYSQIMGSLSGSTVFGIRQDVLRKIKVIVPKLEIQKKFEKIILPLIQRIKSIDEENQPLSSLRDWLLPMLMNGQVKVGGNEAEESMGMAAEGEVVYGEGG
ncbi:MAG: restriction endonuclease subunit S [Bacteroidota bacterium]|nr:restriction endonuclease subunit S [Bacteroidota bacterium]